MGSIADKHSMSFDLAVMQLVSLQVLTATKLRSDICVVTFRDASLHDTATMRNMSSTLTSEIGHLLWISRGLVSAGDHL